MKKFFCLLFAVLMMVMTFANAGYIEGTLPRDEGESLGSIYDDEGTADSAYSFEEHTGVLPFSSRAKGLFILESRGTNDLLTSAPSNKSFYAKDLVGDVGISGTLSYEPSTNGEIEIKAGVCTYNNYMDIYEPIMGGEVYFIDGDYNEVVLDKAIHSQHVKEYGFIKNVIGDYVHKVVGSLFFMDMEY